MRRKIGLTIVPSFSFGITLAALLVFSAIGSTTRANLLLGSRSYRNSKAHQREAPEHGTPQQIGILADLLYTLGRQAETLTLPSSARRVDLRT